MNFTTPEKKIYEDTVLAFMLRTGRFPKSKFSLSEGFFYNAINKTLFGILSEVINSNHNLNPNFIILKVNEKIKVAKQKGLNIAYCSQLIADHWIDDLEEIIEVLANLAKNRLFIENCLKSAKLASDVSNNISELIINTLSIFWPTPITIPTVILPSNLDMPNLD